MRSGLAPEGIKREVGRFGLRRMMNFQFCITKVARMRGCSQAGMWQASFLLLDSSCWLDLFDQSAGLQHAFPIGSGGICIPGMPVTTNSAAGPRAGVWFQPLSHHRTTDGDASRLSQQLERSNIRANGRLLQIMVQSASVLGLLERRPQGIRNSHKPGLQNP